MACQKLNPFNSRVFTLNFTWNCCRLLEARKFSRNPGLFKWATRETRYHISIIELLKRNLMSQVAELFRRPRTMLKMPYFSGDHQFFQKSLGINFLYDRARELSIYWSGRHNLGPGGHFQQNNYPGRPPRRIWLGHLGRVNTGLKWWNFSYLRSSGLYKFQCSSYNAIY